MHKPFMYPFYASFFIYHNIYIVFLDLLFSFYTYNIFFFFFFGFGLKINFYYF